MTWDNCGPDLISSGLHLAMGLALLAVMVAHVTRRPLPVLLQVFNTALLVLVALDIGRWLVKFAGFV